MERSTYMLLIPVIFVTKAAVTAPTQPVILGSARFSPISPSLIRLELGTAGVWDTRPTLSYPGGRAPVLANHTVTRPSSDVVIVTTDELVRIGG